MHTFDINRPASEHNPFRVPEGYFEQMACSVMQRIKRLPAAQPVTELPIVRWLPWLGAACVAALTFVFVQVGSVQSANDEAAHTADAQSATPTFVDDAYDYIMLADANAINAYETDY